MTRIGSTEVSILARLADHEHVTVSDIGHACGVVIASAQGRLKFLKTQGLVTGKLNNAVPSARVYTITAKGRRRVEL